jgi:hypothetical protein
MIWPNKRKLLLLLAFFGVCFYFMGSSGGVGTFQREDRTGSPLSLNSSCGTCHYGGNFQSSLVLTVLKDSLPVKAYLPNTDYLINVSIPSIIPAKVYGLQLAAFQSGNNQQAGTFGTLTSNLRAVELWNRTYIEQSKPQRNHSFFIPWKSPQKDIGPVHFYASGLAANENNNTSGDSPAKLETPFILPAEAITKLVERDGNEKISWMNEGEETYVLLENFSPGHYVFHIYDYFGRTMYQNKVDIKEESIQLPGVRLTTGFYVASIFDGTLTRSTSFYNP